LPLVGSIAGRVSLCSRTYPEPVSLKTQTWVPSIATRTLSPVASAELRVKSLSQVPRLSNRYADVLLWVNEAKKNAPAVVGSRRKVKSKYSARAPEYSH